MHHKPLTPYFMNEKLKDTPREPTASKRADVVKMLSEVSPGTDFSDDEILFARIIDDYAEYARLLTEFDAQVAAAELKGRNARIEEMMSERWPDVAGDGLPHLCGSGSTRAGWGESIFDIAGKA